MWSPGSSSATSSTRMGRPDNRRTLGLAFGNGGASGPGNTLFFTAGPDDEANGLFGMLTPVPAELNDNDEP